MSDPPEKKVPRLAAEARAKKRLQEFTKFVETLVPQSHLVADYVVLGSLLFCPELGAQLVNRIHTHAFTKPLHQVLARCAISGLKAFWRAPLGLTLELVAEAGIRENVVAIEWSTLREVANVVSVCPELVGPALSELRSRRPRVAA